MHHRLMRTTIAIILMLGILPGMIDPASAQEQEEDMHLLALPILVAYCEQDPGNMLQPGGGRFSPQQIMAEYNCDPAEKISVTVSNLDIDFFARCDTGDDGMCEIEGPTDPERELMVAIHMTTVPPGFAPVEVVKPTVHFTEFTGVGIPLLAVDGATPASDEERTALAVNVATCEDGTLTPGCEREPASALVQASTAEVTAEGAPWLATNEEGWVSFDLDALEGDSVDLMFQTEDEPRFACTDLDSGNRLDAEWIEGREGNFIRVTPISNGDINCDVTLASDDSM